MPVAGEPVIRPTTTPTPLPTNTPAPTFTPTITPTPTPTAPPVALIGDPLAQAIHDPAPQAGAPCGVVDILDFPLDPPDAVNIARGGQDFGRFRDRYDGYHAGEDWWGPGGRNGSLGEPVYSIGHGQVTFAHPYGWGIDQGTVILRHVYPDGQEFYSFYGHLDPPSVQLRFGECITRGQKIGEIGRPRGTPHLHFEVRLHTPGDPGPGYWSDYPTLSGWLSPSQTIWNRRIGVSPGVMWLRPHRDPGIQGAGLWQGNTLVFVEDTRLVGLDVGDGALRWQATIAEEEEGELFDFDDDEDRLPPIGDLAIDHVAPILYTADRQGRISAITLPQETAEGALTPESPQLAWDLQLHNVSGEPELIPLPSGGVVLIVQRRMIAFSPEGALLWREPFQGQPRDWLLLENSVLVSAPGDEAALWELSAEGMQPWNISTAGHLADAAGQLFLYDGDAVLWLNRATLESELFFDLPDGLSSQGDIIALPDGGLLLGHMDGDGRRLIALNGDGSLRWQRAYADLLAGNPRLFISGAQPYLLSEEGSDDWRRLSIYMIDLQNAELTRIFGGGTRDPIPGGTWLYGDELGHFLLNIGGGSLVALDAGIALQLVCGEQAGLPC